MLKAKYNFFCYFYQRRNTNQQINQPAHEFVIRYTGLRIFATQKSLDQQINK